MSWNGYPPYVWNKIMKRLENKKNTKNTDTLEQENISIFAEYPMQEYKDKNTLKIWLENSKDTQMNHLNKEIFIEPKN